jgi:hypothetical protein
MGRTVCIFMIIFNVIAVTPSYSGIAGKVVGVIKDGNTGDPLIGVNVMIEGTALGAASDMDGVFYIMNVPPGVYTIQAQMIGYKTTFLSKVRVKIDQTTPVNFMMEQSAIKGDEITIVAKRPTVELDLTASKQTLSDTDIRSSWGVEVEEVIQDLPGVNIHGGIRGGFGLDVAYVLDGMDMRDIGSNSNFTAINLTTIQELEVLTGGFNAEYGQANGAFINLVTKNARDRIHGVVSYKLRPAGKYHWGTNIYDQNDFFHTIASTPEFWDPNSTWQTQWMDEPLPGYNGEKEPFISMTPEERAAWWENFINDENLHPQINYAEQMQWETEITLYGPITRKLGFMVSGRYREGVPIYPSALRYNPDMTFQANLSYVISTKSKLELNGIYTKYTNTGTPNSNWGSTEDTYHDRQPYPFANSPYHDYKFWFYGVLSGSWANIRPPEKGNMLNLQAKITHIFSPQSFLEVAIQHGDTEFKMDYLDILRSRRYGPDGQRVLPEPERIPNAFFDFRWDRPGDIWRKWIWSRNNTIKADFTSQLNIHHQLKTGILFSLQEYDKLLHDYQSSGDVLWAQVSDLAETKTYPYEGAFYVQDKMEFQGMVINAGIRVDFFNANKNVSADIFDPLMIGEHTVGHTGPLGHISWDPNASGPGYQKTPLRVAVSPRLGISHAITKNTVLHFMIGKFHQRPPWNKIIGPAIARTLPPDGIDSEWNMDPNTQLVFYKYYTDRFGNPALTYEKMDQYEAGFKQNIANQFSLDVTLYYKNASDLTSRGIHQSHPDLNSAWEISNSGGYVRTRLYGDPDNPTLLREGEGIGYFRTTTNGAWAQVRGIEATFTTRFRYFNINLNYTMSILNTGGYYFGHLYKDFDGEKLGKDEFHGADNDDNGHNGEDDDMWNPHNSAIIQLSVVTPRRFGPSLGRFHPFGFWSIATTTRWVDGQVFTYHSPDDASIEPNNMKWKGRWNTNMNVSKKIWLYSGITAKFSLRIRNLFNQKHLRLPSGEDARIEYFENGILPYHPTTKEPLIWDWYSNQPREIIFGMTLEF